MIRRHLAALNIACGLAALSLAALAGCKDDSQSAYGSQPQSPTSSAMTVTAPDGSMVMPPPNVIPAGARKVSQGTYQQIQFTVPSDGAGSIYVYDMTTQKVVGMTNSVEANANKSMTMADLKQTAQGLNMTDQYQIYFAPNHPTTAPIGSPSM